MAACLADGREIPCFGLTSPEAGSDAASMTDTGLVIHGEWQGEAVVGIRLDWRKRYITLRPVATVLGLAFRLTNPEGCWEAKRISASPSRSCPPTYPTSSK